MAWKDHCEECRALKRSRRVPNTFVLLRARFLWAKVGDRSKTGSLTRDPGDHIDTSTYVAVSTIWCCPYMGYSYCPALEPLSDFFKELERIVSDVNVLIGVPRQTGRGYIVPYHKFGMKNDDDLLNIARRVGGGHRSCSQQLLAATLPIYDWRHDEIGLGIATGLSIVGHSCTPSAFICSPNGTDKEHRVRVVARQQLNAGDKVS
jgi:hypothetical protein